MGWEGALVQFDGRERRETRSGMRLVSGRTRVRAILCKHKQPLARVTRTRIPNAPAATCGMSPDGSEVSLVILSRGVYSQFFHGVTPSLVEVDILAVIGVPEEVAPENVQVLRHFISRVCRYIHVKKPIPTIDRGSLAYRTPPASSSTSGIVSDCLLNHFVQSGCLLSTGELQQSSCAILLL